LSNSGTSPFNNNKHIVGSASAAVLAKRGDLVTYKASVVIEHDDNGYYAYSPDLPGCQTQGDSFEEAMKNIREAIELYLETLSEEERKTYLSKDIVTGSVEVTVG
jgi:predicted RNase H-like HicB family nuclease